MKTQDLREKRFRGKRVWHLGPLSALRHLLNLKLGENERPRNQVEGICIGGKKKTLTEQERKYLEGVHRCYEGGALVNMPNFQLRPRIRRNWK